jgi:hypothetical protein
LGACFGVWIAVSLLVGELVGRDFVSWPEHDSIWREQESGVRRNLEESGVNTGIPVPQEFMQKIPVKASKNRNSSNPLQNLVPVKNSSGKHRKKRNPQESCFFFFCF